MISIPGRKLSINNDLEKAHNRPPPNSAFPCLNKPTTTRVEEERPQISHACLSWSAAKLRRKLFKESDQASTSRVPPPALLGGIFLPAADPTAKVGSWRLTRQTGPLIIMLRHSLCGGGVAVVWLQSVGRARHALHDPRARSRVPLSRLRGPRSPRLPRRPGTAVPPPGASARA